MLPYPAIDPVAVSFGPVRLHWYGVMYIAAFLAAWLLGRCRAARPGSGWTADQVDDLATWAMLGVVLGARLGYILFYDLDTYLADPLEVFRVWNGGMSFHGGLVGVLSAALWWSLRHKKRFLDVTDFVAPLVPPGLFFGRLGNFINGELWGKVTTVDWGMVFPGAGELPRHPALRGRTGRTVAVHDIMGIFPQTASSGRGIGPVRRALCPVPHRGGIFPPARSSTGLPVFRLGDYGPGIVPPSAVGRRPAAGPRRV